MYDIIIIGGGTSGLMAAVTAAENGAKVLLLEKNKSLGKKLLLTGGTRCNVTNNRPAKEVINHIPGNGKFLYSAFSRFDNYDIIDFFETRGVELKEEDHGRMFPVTDSAQTILDVFIHEIKRLGIDVKTNASVRQLWLEDGVFRGIILPENEKIAGKTLILACGGKAYPRTGTTGDGYKFAKQIGHTITPLYPTEVPVTSDEPFIKDRTLQGLALRNIRLSVEDTAGKTVIAHEMDMIFTHFGVSGPAVLRCSMFIHATMAADQSDTVTMALDCVPTMTRAELEQHFKLVQAEQGAKATYNVLKNLMPERFAHFICEQCGIDSKLPFKQLNHKQLLALIEKMKHFTFQANGTLPIEKGFVTGGGVELKEIEPHSMQSKLNENVFFCGELLDINGYTGGYNITAAFITGHTAGENAAWQAMSI